MDDYLGENHIRELEKARRSAHRLERLLYGNEAVVRRSLGIKALEKVAGEIAIYFKDVLSAVAGYGRLLQAEMDRKDPLRKYAGLILAHAETGKSLMNNLMSVGERGRVTLASLNINHLILEMSRFLSGIVKRSIRLQTLLSDEELRVMADPTQMARIFASLVRHLAGVMTSGGTMTILTKVVPMENPLAQGSENRGCAFLSIRSDDVSRARAERREPGRHREGKGVLLALSAARRIIEEHRGVMRIGGRRGETLEFNIYLPVLP
jgi:nitrogen-specific signal transduction histidine kinase